MSFDLQEIQKRVRQMQVTYEAALAQCRTERRALIAAEEAVAHCEEAQALIQAVVQEIQNRVHQQIARVVSQALEAVFDEPYEFRICFEQKRGRTEAALTFVRNGMEVDPMTASGGGVVDVAAFALRLSCILLHKPALRRCAILDEPFKFVSNEFRGRLRSLLLRLAEEMGLQIIIVTHIPELKVGKVIELC